MSIREKVLVLHVKTGYEYRATHIEEMLKEKGISFEYITDGDKTDLTPEILKYYFAGCNGSNIMYTKTFLCIRAYH